MVIGVIEVRDPGGGASAVVSPAAGALTGPGQVWWYPDDGDEVLVLDSGELAQGHLCKDCGTLVVPPERR